MAGRAPALELESAPPPLPRRPRLLMIGTGFACAGTVAAFLGILAVYLTVRAQIIAADGSFLPEGVHIPLSPGNMSAVTLGMSLVTVLWAVYAGNRADRPHAYQALGVTVLFGLAYIVQIGYLYTQWNLPLNGEGTTQAVLLFTITGAHLAVTIAGLIFLVLMLIRTLGGQFTGRDAEGLTAAALYWSVTVGLFLVIWYAVLIAK